MTKLTLPRKKLAAAVAGGLIVVGGGGAAAFAATSSSSPATTSIVSATTPAPSTTTPAQSAAKKAHPRADAALRAIARSEHTTLEVDTAGKWITVTIDRGQIAAVSPTSITLTRPDGTTATLTVTSSTKVRGDVKLESGLAVGQRAVVTSVGGSATSITQREAKAAGSHASTTTTSPSTVG